MGKNIDFEKEKSDAKWEINILIFFLIVWRQRIFSNAFGNIWLFLLPLLLVWLVACIWCQILIKKQPENFFHPIFQIRRVSFYSLEVAFIIVFTCILFFFHVPALNLFS